MSQWVRRIDKLSQDYCIIQFFFQFSGSLNGAFHPLFPFSQYDPGTISSKQFSAFHAHRLWHYKNRMVSFRSRNGCQSDPGISAGRFDDRSPWLQDSFLFRCLDHLQSRPILYTSRRIEVFQFYQNFRLQSFFFLQILHFQKRGSSNQFCDTLINFCHLHLLLNPCFIAVRYNTFVCCILTFSCTLPQASSKSSVPKTY